MMMTGSEKTGTSPPEKENRFKKGDQVLLTVDRRGKEFCPGTAGSIGVISTTGYSESRNAYVSIVDWQNKTCKNARCKDPRGCIVFNSALSKMSKPVKEDANPEPKKEERRDVETPYLGVGDVVVLNSDRKGREFCPSTAGSTGIVRREFFSRERGFRVCKIVWNSGKCRNPRCKDPSYCIVRESALLKCNPMQTRMIIERLSDAARTADLYKKRNDELANQLSEIRRQQAQREDRRETTARDGVHEFLRGHDHREIAMSQRTIPQCPKCGWFTSEEICPSCGAVLKGGYKGTHITMKIAERFKKMKKANKKIAADNKSAKETMDDLSKALRKSYDKNASSFSPSDKIDAKVAFTDIVDIKEDGSGKQRVCFELPRSHGMIDARSLAVFLSTASHKKN